MKLVNILALTQAKLINNPFVSSFENIVFETKKVKRGDLFIAFEESDIEEAIFNGAYGVVFDKPTQISDSEIAWIKVDNLDESLKKLLRFRLIEKKTINYQCDEVTLELSKQILTKQNFITIDKDIKDIFLYLWDIEENSIILFSKEKTDKSIFTDINNLPNNTNKNIKIIEKTLFETSFIYDDIFYDRQLISPYFIPYLENLFNLYKKLKIDFRVKKLSPIKHFEAVFINKKLQIKEFGSTDIVTIFESNIELLNSQINFLQKNASWANIIYLIDDNKIQILQENENIFTYKTKNDIVDILQKNNFHFALISTNDKSILKREIIQQPQLF